MSRLNIIGVEAIDFLALQSKDAQFSSALPSNLIASSQTPGYQALWRSGTPYHLSGSKRDDTTCDTAVEPVLDMAPHTGHQQSDANGTLQEKDHNAPPNPISKVQRRLTMDIVKFKAHELRTKATKPFVPAGGYDATPVPDTPPGLTVKITFHRATHLPIADISTLSSDPYLMADLYVTTPSRHREDSPLQFRTPTKRRRRDPVWDATWIIANVPRNGFKLKMRIFDEDQADHDDRLGNAYLAVPSLSESWSGIQEQSLRIRKRVGSKRAYLIRGCAAIFIPTIKMTGEVVVSVEVLGPTESQSRKVYTIGPQYWVKHYSPMIGMMIGTKGPMKQGKPERYKYEACLAPFSHVWLISFS